MNKMMITSELIPLFHQCFPYVIRDDASILSVAQHEKSRVLERRSPEGRLIGTAILNDGTILMLCVEKAWRRQGIGSSLLEEAERIAREEGHEKINAGVGYTYLMPGVPTRNHRLPTVNEQLDERVTAEGERFFVHHGYGYGGECDYFDMRFLLSDMPEEALKEANTGDIAFRWAEKKDMDAVWACTEDAMPDFTPYYRNERLYQGGAGRENALLAVCGDDVVGAVIAGVDSEPDGLGSIGCTCVRQAFRGRGIASSLACRATARLKEQGLRESWLSYTYTGLDKMYGRAGYRISVYYMMAEKKLC